VSAKGSFSVKILKGLLSGGAHVVIISSCYNRSTVEYYQSIYQTVGSRGSALTVVPSTRVSKQDVEALVELHLRYTRYGSRLHTTLRCHSRECHEIDSPMTINRNLRIISCWWTSSEFSGAVKAKKASRHFVTRPTQVYCLCLPTTIFSNMASTSNQNICLRHCSIVGVSESWVSLPGGRCHWVIISRVSYL